MAPFVVDHGAFARLPHLRDYQVETAIALLRGIERRRGATFTVMFPRQAGKNEVSAVVVACLLRMHAETGGTVIVCAPTLLPQAEISLDRLRRVLRYTARLFPGAGRAVVSGNTVTVGRASAIFLSASPAAHVAGHTASFALIADEAQEIEADWFNRQFRPMAASTAAPTILFGTAWDGETLLEKQAEQNRAVDAATARPVPFHHQVSWEQVAASRPGYGDYVRQERARLGANHPLFLSQYELVGAEGAGRLLAPAQLDLLEGEHERLDTPVEGERYVAGIDFGGDGDHADRTVMTIGRVSDGRCEVVQHVTWPRTTLADVGQLAALCRKWRLGRVVVDATGMGAPHAARLEETPGLPVERFVFTTATKSALGFGLIAAVDGGVLALYRDDGSAEARDCRHELRTCRGSFPGYGRIRWAAPAGEHDDYVASLALCQHAAASLGQPRLAVGRPGSG